MLQKFFCLSIYLLLLVLPQAATGQAIWPGDVNNNGVVNGVDLLYWGQAFGATGPSRATGSTDWSAQVPPSAWSQSFPTGLNFAYADCDGNGEVNEEDFDQAIEVNFGLEQGTLQSDGYLNAPLGAGPRLRMEASATLVEPGMTIDIDLFLDDSDLSPVDFYGLALKMSYTTDLLQDDDGPDFDFTENSWLEAGDDNAQELYINDDENGTAELAFTRTNQSSVSIGTEAIGRFQVIVEDIIVGLQLDTILITIDSVLLVNMNLTGIATQTDTLRIVVVQDTTNVPVSTRTITPQFLAQEIVIYPNPLRNSFFIESALPIEQLLLIDALGRQLKLPLPATSGIPQRVELPTGLTAGLYYLRIVTPDGECSKKIKVLP